MTRSRITLTIDESIKTLIIRYIGTLDGDEVNESMISKLANVPDAWVYDSIIDMRRYEGTIMSSEIEELSLRWNLLAQGRDAGGCIAIISDDPLVRARLSTTRTFFPLRTLEVFDHFEDGCAWIKAKRGYVDRAMAI
ncbi:MAG: hypothetical protein WBQ60_12990 [Asticcacaulis sp.]